MKTLCWLISGHPSIDGCMPIIDAYVKGGCEGFEWTIPYANPYIGQAYRFNNESNAYKNCPDMDKHLELIAKTRKKYPAIDIYPSLCKETMQMIGISRMIQFCKENKIDDILTIGDYDQDMLDEIKQGGIKNSTEVSYYMTDGEIASAKNATGFIIMQAFPYPEEIQAGYTRERLAECVKALREDFGIQRPIYCAQGIRKLEDIKEIEAAGADGFILGSLLFDHYHDLDSLSRTIHSFKETQ